MDVKLKHRFVSNPMHARMVGYLATLAVQVSTALYTTKTFSVAEDPVVKHFYQHQYAFLTVWNAYSQMLFAIVAISCEVLSLASEKETILLKALRSIKDPLFSCVVFPFSMTISIVFWTLFSYDRTLILPPAVDQLLGNANHAMHTSIAPLALWELMFKVKQPSKSLVPYLTGLYVFCAAYLIVLISTFIKNGAWIYPVLNLLHGTIYFYSFFIITILIVTIFFFIQWPLNSLMWKYDKVLMKKD